MNAPPRFFDVLNSQKDIRVAFPLSSEMNLTMGRLGHPRHSLRPSNKKRFNQDSRCSQSHPLAPDIEPGLFLLAVVKFSRVCRYQYKQYMEKR